MPTVCSRATPTLLYLGIWRGRTLWLALIGACLSSTAATCLPPSKAEARQVEPDPTGRTKRACRKRGVRRTNASKESNDFGTLAGQLAIAVGTPVAWCPPHRPGRALISASGSYLG